MVGKQEKKKKMMKRKKKREEGEERGEKTKQRGKVTLGLMEMRREMGELEAIVAPMMREEMKEEERG
jgi:hypothetical protein